MELKDISIYWLIDKVITKKHTDSELNHIFNQAKAMHKDEMANTWIKACEDILNALQNDTVASFSSEELFNQYYNETFKGQDNE